jgi:hypothetical protein
MTDNWPPIDERLAARHAFFAIARFKPITPGLSRTLVLLFCGEKMTAG